MNIIRTLAGQVFTINGNIYNKSQIAVKREGDNVGIFSIDGSAIIPYTHYQNIELNGVIFNDGVIKLTDAIAQRMT